MTESRSAPHPRASQPHARNAWLCALLIVGFGGTRLAAQSCDPVPDSLAARDQATIPLPLHAAHDVVLRALRERGFDPITTGDPAFIRTQEHIGWPSKPGLEHWRTHPHPGVAMAATLVPRRDTTILILLAQASCAVPTDQPLHNHIPVEHAAALAAIEDIFSAILGGLIQLQREGTHLSDSSDFVPPTYQGCFRPHDADSSRVYSANGIVRFSVIIDSLGHLDPQSVRLVSSPSPDLVPLARDVLARCHFEPARRSGRATAARVEIPVRFGP